MAQTTTGAANVAVGHDSLRLNATGSNNVALGYDSLRSNTASNNTAVGYQAVYNLTTGGFNTFFGNATQSSAAALTGEANATFGYNAGTRLQGASGSNTLIGTSAGNLITTGSKNTIIGRYDGNYGGLDIRTSSNYIVLSDGDANPRGIFDGSGNFLVGKTAIGTGTDGFEARASGYVAMSDTSSAALNVNRNTTDGALAYFYKDGTTVGSIGAYAGHLSLGNTDTGLLFNDTIKSIYAFNVSTLANNDNAIDLGWASVRFDDIYATNGTIQTSDRNEKQDIEVLSEAEQRVAVAAKGMLRKFRWKDAVEEKGDDARIHFGIIAQDLQAAFEAEGLDAGRYAMFISTTWTDEETGEERSRMGVRYSELLAFIIAAI